LFLHKVLYTSDKLTQILSHRNINGNKLQVEKAKDRAPFFYPSQTRACYVCAVLQAWMIDKKKISFSHVTSTAHK